MSFESERLAIETKFHNEWAHWNGYPIVFYDNTKTTAATGVPYLRLTVENVDSKQASLGGTKLFRNHGLIFITAFVSENEGTKKIREYIDRAATIFRFKTFNGIVCRAPYQPSPAAASNGWYRMSIAVPYFCDEVAT